MTADDDGKSREELAAELQRLRARLAELERAASSAKGAAVADLPYVLTCRRGPETDALPSPRVRDAG